MTHVAFGHAPQSRKAEDTPWNRNESVLPRRILNSKQKDLRTLEERQFRRRQGKPIQYFSASLAQATFSSTTCCRCGEQLKGLTVFQESNAHLTLLESDARLRTLIQLEIAPRKLRGSSYSASLRQKLFGTAKKTQDNVVLKGSYGHISSRWKVKCKSIADMWGRDQLCRASLDAKGRTRHDALKWLVVIAMVDQAKDASEKSATEQK